MRRILLAFTWFLLLAASLAAAGSAAAQVVDSTDAGTIDCPNGSLSRGGIGDLFRVPSQPTRQVQRCTWRDISFAVMRGFYDFSVSLRWEVYSESDSDHAGIAYLRQNETSLTSGCSGGGNNGNQALLLRVERKPSPDHWQLQVRGGASPSSAAPVDFVDLGPISAGQIDTFRFQLHPAYDHGSLTLWHNGKVAYSDLDRPIGFHFACDGVDISAFKLRMQHGIYRHATPGWTLTSSGFIFS
jgi:hypothetical protein